MTHPATRLEDLAQYPQLRTLLVEHGRRGVRVQAALRLALGVLAVAIVLLQPPARFQVACDFLAIGYLAWGLVLSTVATRSEKLLPYMWSTLFVDLIIITLLTVLSGVTNATWTSDIFVFGFFLIPLLSATQLRPWLSAAVCIPTVALYFASGVFGRIGNDNEPWDSIILRTLVLVAASIGSVLLSRVQRSRVMTLSQLALERAALVAELVGLEDRERRDLSEALHDGALQYVLAARMDLEDLEPQADPLVYQRIDDAVSTAAKLLRSTVFELHPAVLERSGLRPAVEELATTAGARGGFAVVIESTEWEPGLRTDADQVLYATVRELLNNVVKHAGAKNVAIHLQHRDGAALVEVMDDGRGISQEEIEKKLAAGHIGLSSRRARLEAVGGTFAIRPRQPAGTTVEVHVPAGILT